MRRRLLCLLVLSLSLLAACERDPACETLIVEQVNGERVAANLAPLAVDNSQYGVPLHWAIQMAANAKLGHNPDYGTQLSWNGIVGENTARGDHEAFTSAWMNSPRHRANILEPRYRYTSVACIVHDGQDWATQNFWD